MARLLALLCVTAAWVLALSVCSPPGGDGDGDGDSDGDADADCVEGEIRCRGAGAEECVDGAWQTTTCEGICVEGLGCVACDPRSRWCEGNTVMECLEDGSASRVVIECDASAGEQCSGGFCTDACDEAMENRSNLGCEYWAVDLDNAENRIVGMPSLGDNAAGGQFAVALANPDPYLSAHVTAEINNAPYGEPLDLEVVAEVDIPPGGLEILELPRRDADGDNITTHVDDGPQTWISSRAFRITSTAPVVAYQFNTIDQRFSNDASLLLPTSGLDVHHIVLGYPPANAIRVPMFDIPPSRAYVAVVGTEESTVVRITPTSRTFEGPNIPALQPGETFEATIGPFDLINLETDTVTLAEAAGGHYPDLTGTIVEATRPVAVFFGTDLSVVSPEGDTTDIEEDSCCAEHLESQILPTSAMGTRFVVSRSPQRSHSTPEPDVYRVLAVVDGTTVTTNLAGPAASFSLNAGEHREFNSAEPFVLTTNDDHPVHVGQFLVSQGFVADHTIGDPSFLMFPAVDEWRGTYIFVTGRGFDEDYVSIAMPTGASLTLDGEDIAARADCATQTIGDLGDVGYVQVTCPIEDGVHEVDSGENPVGVTVYGYYNAGSYAYSAGSELHRIFLI